MSRSYQTLAAEHRYEVEPIKGSRFLASVAPAASEAGAEEFIARVSDEFARATHNCWAYRIGPDGESIRSSDDGEPSNSAGRPILQQIEGHGLTNTVVVVTRWFGGTKLGVGGLMRAYGGAAGQALDRARLRTVHVTVRVRLSFPYSCSGPIQGLLTGRSLEPTASDYGEIVSLWLEVAEGELAEITRELTDCSAGRASLRVDPDPDQR